eukprot:TRINITY_DN5974_c1_g4_i1.p1 TRINITY_DN5974_c1_g4~~TRINITY_DN5974_c1_g4_i1.p1  ORF type:complete len:818 (+),score=156.53 TRINITY_DN5974_c1_g4_i1:81-2534(+)
MRRWSSTALFKRLSSKRDVSAVSGVMQGPNKHPQLAQAVMPPAPKNDPAGIDQPSNLDQLAHMVDVGRISCKSLPPSTVANIAQSGSFTEGLALAVAKWLTTANLTDCNGDRELEVVAWSLINVNFPTSTQMLYSMTESPKGLRTLCRLNAALVFHIIAAHKAHSWGPKQEAAIRQLSSTDVAQMLRVAAVNEGYPSVPCARPVLDVLFDATQAICGSSMGFAEQDCTRVLRSLHILNASSNVKRGVVVNATRNLDQYSFVDLVQLVQALVICQDSVDDADDVAEKVCEKLGCRVLSAADLLASNELLDALPQELGATVSSSTLDASDLLAMMQIAQGNEDVCSYPGLIKVLAAHLTTLLQGGAEYISPASLIYALCSVSQAGVQAPRMFVEISKHLQCCLGTLPPARIGCLAAAYATSNHYCNRLFKELEAYITDEEKRSKIDGMTAITLLYVMAALNHPVDSRGVMLTAINIMSEWVEESPEVVATKASTLSWSLGVLMQSEKHESVASLISTMAGILTKLGVVRLMPLEGVTGLLWGITSVLKEEIMDPVVVQLFSEAQERCCVLKKEDSISMVQSSAVLLWCFTNAFKTVDGEERDMEFVSVMADAVCENFLMFISSTTSEVVYLLSCIMCHAPESAVRVFEKLAAFLTQHPSSARHLVQHLYAPGTAMLVQGFLSTHTGDDELLGMLFEHCVSHEVSSTYIANAASAVAICATQSEACPPYFFEALKYILAGNPLSEEAAGADPNTPVLLDILSTHTSHDATHVPLSLRPHRRRVPEGVPYASQPTGWPSLHKGSPRFCSDIVVAPYKMSCM